MKRILFFATEFPPGPGGIGEHAYQVARHLAQNQWEVAVLTKQDYASPEEIRWFNHQQPFPVSQWPYKPNLVWRTYQRELALVEKINSFQPHILLASGEGAVRLMALVAQKAIFRGIRWIAIWHGTTQTRPCLRAISRWAYQQPLAVIAVSHYGLERFLQMGGKPQTSRVIHNGADPERFYPVPKSEAEAFRRRFAPADAQVLLTVGHVSQRKGQEVVVRALPQIVKTFPAVQYWMAGLPTLQVQLEHLAKKLGVLDHIRFLGKLDESDLRLAYNACDLFLMTSRRGQDGQFEGYGIAAVEAALCGKPAVVSDNSGLVEAILPGETGLVARENDPESTAQAVIQLLENPHLRGRMGLKAQERALAEQTWAIRAQEYDRFLSGLASGAAPYGGR